MAELTGLEPAAFRVTGGRYNQLNYHPTSIWRIFYSHTDPVIQHLFYDLFKILRILLRFKHD